MALRFKKDDYVKITGVSGDYRYGYIQETADGQYHLVVCMHEEGESRLEYETRAAQWMGVGRVNWAKDLTKTEQKLLQWLASSVVNKQMATMLGLSESTIRGHLRTLRLKLQVENRVQLVLMAQGMRKRVEEDAAMLQKRPKDGG